MNISNNLARCIEDGLENVAIVDREIEIDSTVYACLLATKRAICDAWADGYISRRERHDIDTRLAVVEAGLVQTIALDVEDLELSRRLAGRLDGMSRKQKAPVGAGARGPLEKRLRNTLRGV
jgi:hypothetical protein